MTSSRLAITAALSLLAEDPGHDDDARARNRRDDLIVR